MCGREGSGMGILRRSDDVGRTPAIDSPAVLTASTRLAELAILRVKDGRGGVRAEDYITVLAALTGEAALVAAELFDIETTPMTPGAGVFGDGINVVLTGDVILTGDKPDIEKVRPDSVVGILVEELVPAWVPLEAFRPLDALYASVAANVGKAPWGQVTTSVAEEHQPHVIPLQVAFELRAAVDALQSDAGLPRTHRHVICARALATGLKETKAALDVTVAVTLALEVVFGMAKMVPMSKTAFDKVAKERAG